MVHGNFVAREDRVQFLCLWVFELSTRETTVPSDQSLHSVAAAAATSWAAERLALVQLLEGLQSKSCLQLGMTLRTKPIATR